MASLRHPLCGSCFSEGCRKEFGFLLVLLAEDWLGIGSVLVGVGLVLVSSSLVFICTGSVGFRIDLICLVFLGTESNIV